MSYITYTTNALVCGSFDQNTSDRTYRLFTKDLGMLYASARSVREERSRQRYALQEFSQIRVSLVKGKHIWKIGSVEVCLNDYVRATSREARGSVVIVYRTLRRFIHGEEALPQLFDFSREALALLSGETKNRSLLELYVQVQILLELGYLNEKILPENLKGMSILKVESLMTNQQGKELQKLIAIATLNSQL